jgi:hypothetical protein
MLLGLELSNSFANLERLMQVDEVDFELLTLCLLFDLHCENRVSAT